MSLQVAHPGRPGRRTQSDFFLDHACAVRASLGRAAQKPHRNPLVPLGAFVTTAVLCTGLYAFKTNNVKLSQKMMRMRVMAQVRPHLLLETRV